MSKHENFEKFFNTRQTNMRFFCAAAIKYILTNNLNICQIIKETKDGIFQIYICKIVLEKFLGETEKIFKINENIDKEIYNLFYNANNMIGIQKNFKIDIKV